MTGMPGMSRSSRSRAGRAGGRCVEVHLKHHLLGSQKQQQRVLPCPLGHALLERVCSTMLDKGPSCCQVSPPHAREGGILQVQVSSWQALDRISPAIFGTAGQQRSESPA